MNSSESDTLKKKEDYQNNLSLLWHPMPRASSKTASPATLHQSTLEVNNSDLQSKSTAKIIVGHQISNYQLHEKSCCTIQ